MALTAPKAPPFFGERRNLRFLTERGKVNVQTLSVSPSEETRDPPRKRKGTHAVPFDGPCGELWGTYRSQV